jgi:hypothetical protein
MAAARKQAEIAVTRAILVLVQNWSLGCHCCGCFDVTAQFLVKSQIATKTAIRIKIKRVSVSGESIHSMAAVKSYRVLATC